MIMVIGSGIVGAATARELTNRGHDVLVVDKEEGPARHQSGRNSGVVHSGIYYRHGSDKQQLTAEGRAALARYIADRSLPWRALPKLIVATEADELAPLRNLEVMAQRNDIATRRLGRQGIADTEPGVVGRSALLVETTAITDFAAVTTAFLDDVRAQGGEVRFGVRVERIEPGRCHTDRGEFAATTIVNCAGADTTHLALGAGVPTDVRIVGFRGAYWSTERAMSHLVYPVPDPRFPFLGAHLTPMLDGGTAVGPTAMLSAVSELGAERGRAGALSPFADPAVRALARRHWRTGLGELARSVSVHALVGRVRRLLPDLETAELRRAPAGIRAQAVRADGHLVDDFLFGESPGAIHVLNAPSPAATASLAIARRIADRVESITR